MTRSMDFYSCFTLPEMLYEKKTHTPSFDKSSELYYVINGNRVSEKRDFQEWTLHASFHSKKQNKMRCEVAAPPKAAAPASFPVKVVGVNFFRRPHKT